jgi:16S rRNA (cytosine1402-N4)-methyltransferase
MTVPAPSHVPVLLEQVLALAELVPGIRVVDGTLGHGGHAEAFLDRGATVLGVDRDPEAVRIATERLPGRLLSTVVAPFDAPRALDAVDAFHPHVILLDLGVSSRQLDADGRGFSFRSGALLDMRMGEEAQSAADLLNGETEAQLADIFHEYGDEPRARALAREVVRRRANAPFGTSDDLVNAIRGTLGATSGPGDFARIFQALRIAVNGELDALDTALPRFRQALEPGGRLLVITYHSGEDRIVKHTFRAWATACTCPPRQPICTCGGVAHGTVSPRKPVVPDAAEVARNPRARSAHLRRFMVFP